MGGLVERPFDKGSVRRISLCARIGTLWLSLDGQSAGFMAPAKVV